MAKNYVTLTIEFNTDAPWEEVVSNLICKIGDIANDELGYLVTKVYNSPITPEEAYDEDEEWFDEEWEFTEDEEDLND